MATKRSASGGRPPGHNGVVTLSDVLTVLAQVGINCN